MKSKFIIFSKSYFCLKLIGKFDVKVWMDLRVNRNSNAFIETKVLGKSTKSINHCTTYLNNESFMIE
jgi:hypothetical protein